jgi:hypothetical protein
MTGNHPEHEDFPWVIAVVDHPPRTESAAYARSRDLMRKIVSATGDWILAGSSYQDHHGGSVWVKDTHGWLCLQLPLGIEWSAQFCADPAKVDQLRQYAARVVAAFPETLPAYRSLGYPDGDRVLATSIKNAAGVADWTDSIFNASMPLPAAAHTGVLPTAAGYHHYPKPIVDIDHFRYADFQLFVKDPAGLPAVVVPVAPRGSGDGRVRLLAAHPRSSYIHKLDAPGSPVTPQAASARAASRPAPDKAADLKPEVKPEVQPEVQPEAQPEVQVQPDVLPAEDPLARKAFINQ